MHVDKLFSWRFKLQYCHKMVIHSSIHILLQTKYSVCRCISLRCLYFFLCGTSKYFAKKLAPASSLFPDPLPGGSLRKPPLLCVGDGMHRFSRRSTMRWPWRGSRRRRCGSTTTSTTRGTSRSSTPWQRVRPLARVSRFGSQFAVSQVFWNQYKTIQEFLKNSF